jgi:chaperonin GroEL
MIQAIMKATGISDVANVVKVGDTEVDIAEGRTAGCGLVISVTTGSFTKEELEAMDVTQLMSIADELGIKLSEADPVCLGSAKTVKITKDHTTIIEGAGTKEDIDALVTQLKNQIATTESEYEKAQLQERVARIAGGVAVIKVGAATEVEMNEKKDRVDDALHATKAAVEEGIVAGGGTALVRAAQSIKMDQLDEDQEIGKRIVLRAIEEPMRQIVLNAGQEPSVIVNKVKELTGNQGYDARDDKFYDLVEHGIIDPVKVTKNALKNAASIASMILTTNCVIVEKKEKEPQAPAMPVGGIPGMM